MREQRGRERKQRERIKKRNDLILRNGTEGKQRGETNIGFNKKNE